MMIILALVAIGTGHGADSSKVALFDFTELPGLIGVSIYAFMTHHSLPSIVTPIEDKRGLNRLFAADMLTIYCYYVVVCVTAVYAFPLIQPLYTLNFSNYPFR
jgi:hypothetical protein